MLPILVFTAAKFVLIWVTSVLVAAREVLTWTIQLRMPLMAFSKPVSFSSAALAAK